MSTSFHCSIFYNSKQQQISSRPKRPLTLSFHSPIPNPSFPSSLIKTAILLGDIQSIVCNDASDYHSHFLAAFLVALAGAFLAIFFTLGAAFLGAAFLGLAGDLAALTGLAGDLAALTGLAGDLAADLGVLGLEALEGLAGELAAGAGTATGAGAGATGATLGALALGAALGLAGDLVALVLGATFLDCDLSAFFAIWNYYLCQFLWYGVYNPRNKSVKFDWLYLIGCDFMAGRMAFPFSFSESTPLASSSHVPLESPSIWSSNEKNMNEVLPCPAWAPFIVNGLLS